MPPNNGAPPPQKKKKNLKVAPRSLRKPGQTHIQSKTPNRIKLGLDERTERETRKENSKHCVKRESPILVLFFPAISILNQENDIK